MIRDDSLPQTHQIGRGKAVCCENSLGAPFSRTSFAIRRTGRLLASLVIVVLASFFVIHMVPGDPVRAALGPTAPTTLVENVRSDLGLDKPITQQFFDYVGGLFSGDLGTSIQTRQEVSEVIGSRFPTTLILAASGFVVALAGGTAARHGRGTYRPLRAG